MGIPRYIETICSRVFRGVWALVAVVNLVTALTLAFLADKYPQQVQDSTVFHLTWLVVLVAGGIWGVVLFLITPARMYFQLEDRLRMYESDQDPWRQEREEELRALVPEFRRQLSRTGTLHVNVQSGRFAGTDRVRELHLWVSFLTRFSTVKPLMEEWNRCLRARDVAWDTMFSRAEYRALASDLGRSETNEPVLQSGGSWQASGATLALVWYARMTVSRLNPVPTWSRAGFVLMWAGFRIRNVSGMSHRQVEEVQRRFEDEVANISFWPEVRLYFSADARLHTLRTQLDAQFVSMEPPPKPPTFAS